MSALYDAPRIIELPKIEDVRGCLSFLEVNKQVPFEINSTSWLYDFQRDRVQRGYACMNSQEFWVALFGEFAIVINDGVGERLFVLNHPWRGLYIPASMWRQVKSYSSDATALVVGSTVAHKAEHVYDYSMLNARTDKSHV